jgi:hypothetical protein
VTSQALLLKIFNRLRKLWFLIPIGGIFFAALLYIYARNEPTEYSVKSSVFPLTTTQDKSISNNKLAELIGGVSGSTKSLSEEASVNIEEVAKSRNTREAVAGEKIESLGNKTVAELLINEKNLRKKFYNPIIEKPNTEQELKSLGASLLKDGYTIKPNKNGLLEIVYASTNEKLITPVSNILISKITQFYIELKLKKAQFDFDFTQRKVDSLDKILASLDKKQIAMNNTTLFVRPNKLQYSIPRENLENSKLQVLTQRNGAASNREEALWRIQKATPILKILDSPNPPFDTVKPSKILYALVGFIGGCILFSFLFIIDLLIKLTNHKVKHTIAEKIIEPALSTSNPTP